MAVRSALSAGFLAVLVGALAGCGNTGDSSGTTADGPDDQDTAAQSASSSPSPSGSSTPSTTPKPLPPLPACKAIWVTGQQLPKVYTGCQRGDRRITADKVGCSSGQTMVHFGGRYYGVLGGLVERVPDFQDKGYLRDYHTCTG